LCQVVGIRLLNEVLRGVQFQSFRIEMLLWPRHEEGERERYGKFCRDLWQILFCGVRYLPLPAFRCGWVVHPGHESGAARRVLPHVSSECSWPWFSLWKSRNEEGYAFHAFVSVDFFSCLAIISAERRQWPNIFSISTWV